MNNLCFMTNLSSSDLAAWVQAIGTIGAVLAALIVVIWQHNLEKIRATKLQRDVVTRYLASAISLAGGVKENAKTLSDWCKGGATTTQNLFFMLKNLESISNALSKIPIWELETFELIVNVVPIQSLSNTLVGIVKGAEAMAKQTLNWIPTTNSILTDLILEIDTILSTLIHIEKDRKKVDDEAKTSIWRYMK